MDFQRIGGGLIIKVVDVLIQQLTVNGWPAFNINRDRMENSWASGRAARHPDESGGESYPVTDYPLRGGIALVDVTPDQRANPCQQLIQRKRLNQIVISAGIESGYALFNGIACGQD